MKYLNIFKYIDYNIQIIQDEKTEMYGYYIMDENGMIGSCDCEFFIFDDALNDAKRDINEIERMLNEF